MPKALIGAPYLARFVVSDSIEIPLFCPATVSISNNSEYLSASIPASPIALVTNCTEVFTSVPFTFANFKKSIDAVFSLPPVKSNLVLISPMAAPISAKSPGTSLATSLSFKRLSR